MTGTLTPGARDGSARFGPDGLFGLSRAALVRLSRGEVDSVAFSPDGKMLATTGSAGLGSARLWNLATDREMGKPIGTHVGSVAFSPDGRILAISGYNSPDEVRLWDVATRQPVGAVLGDGNSDGINAMAFSPDGKTLATAGQDGTIRLWDVATDTFRQAGAVPADATRQTTWVAFSPAGKTIAAISHDDEVALWDVATGRRDGGPLTAGGEISTRRRSRQELNPDTKTLERAHAGGLGIARLWDAVTSRSQVRGSFVGGSAGGYPEAFSPDGTILATTSPAGVPALWNVATGRLVDPAITAGTAHQVLALAFSPDGKTLAISTTYGTIQLWHTATGKEIGKPITEGNSNDDLLSLALSPDGKTLATGSSDGTRLWDLATGHQVGGLLTDPAGDSADAMAFSPDGKTLATGSVDDTMTLWDVADGTGQQIGSPLTVPGGVNSLAYSPDGKMLAAGGGQGTTIWNVSYLTDTVAWLCARPQVAITPTEWTTYVQAGITYRNTCHPIP
jgi:WD40 repeat protein